MSDINLILNSDPETIVNITLDSAPVQAVNGKIGFVTLSPQDIMITGLVTSGDLLNYATLMGLAATGLSLQTQINNLDSVYATDASVTAVANNLATTGSTLQTQINNLGTTYVTRLDGQFTNRPVVNGTGVLLSGEAAKLPDTVVYTTGAQFISGSKTFYADNYIFSGANVIFTENTGIVSGEWHFAKRPTVNNSGLLLQGEIDTSKFVTNLSGVSSIQVITTGDYNSITPLPNVVYILI